MENFEAVEDEEITIPLREGTVYVPVLSSFIGNNGFIYLIVCPECFYLNVPSAIVFGICYHCGYNINEKKNFAIM